MKDIIFFLPTHTLNEATIYYVSVIEECFINAGYVVYKTAKFSDLKNQKNIFVMSAKWCFLVKILNPKAKIVTWFQGLGAEEALMTRDSMIRKRLWNCVEFFSLKYSWLNIYVSEKMHDYYKDTYKIQDKNFFIMPCFNKEMNLDSFLYKMKYQNPSFVYAGGLDKWQCIEETLELFSMIESKLPVAKLTLLTRDKDKALAIAKKFNVKNIFINFVALDRLDDELKKYKYGFIIRKNHIVNNVSTPTKMNSYLANGIIPIYTDVVDDFNKNLKFDQYFLKLKNQESLNDWLEDFLNFELNTLKQNFEKDYLNQVSVVFNEYYSKSKYISSLSELIKRIG